MPLTLIVHIYSKIFQEGDNIRIYENGHSSQARISFAAFHFLADAENSKLFIHCAVRVCQQSSSDECTPECDNRKR